MNKKSGSGHRCNTQEDTHTYTHTFKAVPLSPKCPCSVLKVPTSHCCLQAKRIKVQNTNLACTLLIKTVPPDQIKKHCDEGHGKKTSCKHHRKQDQSDSRAPSGCSLMAAASWCASPWQGNITRQHAAGGQSSLPVSQRAGQHSAL